MRYSRGSAGVFAALVASVGAFVLGTLTDAARSADASTLGGAPRIAVSKLPVEMNTLRPGGTAMYRITVDNVGVVAATGVRLADALPPGLDSMSWTCAGFDGATCAVAAGVGAIDQALDSLVANSTLVYEVVGSVAAAPPAFVANVAIVSLPAGGVCDDGTTPPCRATATMPTGANLAVQVSATAMSLVPGASVTYLVEIANANDAGAADGTRVRAPIAIGLQGASWTCASAGGAVCPAASGTGAIDELVASWPPAGNLTYMITATVAAAPPADVVQSALANPPYGGSCGDFAELPPCVSSNRLGTIARIYLDKTAELAADGGSINYSIVAANAGSSAAGSVVVDALPAGVASFAWTCSATGGAICAQPSGSGAINQTVAAWPTGGQLDYFVTAGVVSGAPASISNTASVTLPGGGACGEQATPPPCTATALVDTNGGGLLISKTVDRDAVAPGETLGYTVTLQNSTAALSANGTVFSDPLPAGIDAFNAWTCTTGAGAAVCPVAGGSGPISATLESFPAGSSLIYSITAVVGSAPPPRIVNTATLTPPAAINVDCGLPLHASPPCVASASSAATPIFSVDKTADAAGASAGATIAYVLNITNFGSDASSVSVDDPLPPGISAASWTCAGSGVACPAPNGVGGIAATVPTFPSGAALSYQVFANVVTASPPASVVNTLTVSPSSGSDCLIGDTATPTPPPCVAAVSTRIEPALVLTNTSEQQQLVLGGSVDYVVTLRNDGGAASGIVLDESQPVGVDRFDWTCSGFGGAACPAFAGSGSLAQTITTLPANASLVYRIRAHVADDAPASITQVATVVPPAGVSCVPATCSASVVQAVASVPSPNIAVTKTADSMSTAPGATVTYTLDIRNVGVIAATAFQISDPLPAGIVAQSWTCAGAECPASAGTGAINQTMPSLARYIDDGGDAVVRAGRVVYTAMATVGATPPAIIDNVIAIAPPAGATCAGAACTASASVSTGAAGSPTLALGQTANATSLVPGSTVQYTLTVANAGSAAAGPTTLVDAIPAGIETFAWSCVATAGVACPASTGNGAINQTIAAIPAGASFTYTIAALVGTAPPASIANTLVVGPPAGTSCVPVACVSTLTLPITTGAPASVSLEKTADRGRLVPGDVVQYTLRLANVGSVDAPPAVLADPIPDGLVSFAWTCSATGTAACPAPGGSGGINTAVALPVASSLVYRVEAGVSTDALGIVINTATYSAPPGVACVPFDCRIQRALQVRAPAGGPAIVVSKSAQPPAGDALADAQPIRWTLLATNTGAPSTAPLTLTDRLPASVRDIVVTAGSGVVCNASTPSPGAELVCTIAAGFSGQRRVEIDAVVAGVDAQGLLRNLLVASGADGPACASCEVAHVVNAVVDIALRNARAFSAAGIPGTLVDVVNLSSVTVTDLSIRVSPDAARRLFAAYASGCTATVGANGQTEVRCPNPPSTHGVRCSGAACTIDALAPGAAATLFVALNAGAEAVLDAPMTNDVEPANNTIALPIGGGP